MRTNEKRRPARGGARFEPGGLRSNYREPSGTASAVITITNEPFDLGFDVTVRPHQEIGHDREFQTHSGAVIYVERLAQATGWRVIDRSDRGLG